jgi:Ser/Thr protein kinase RdoA (MazF antagonist)
MDLAATLQYLKWPLAGNHDHRAHYVALHDALFDGLASVQPLADSLPRRVDLLITARLFLTLEWMLDDWPHLHHRAWGPGFLRCQQQALRDWLADGAGG